MLKRAVSLPIDKISFISEKVSQANESRTKKFFFLFVKTSEREVKDIYVKYYVLVMKMATLEVV